jgi:hypothetical protein
MKQHRPFAPWLFAGLVLAAAAAAGCAGTTHSALPSLDGPAARGAAAEPALHRKAHTGLRLHIPPRRHHRRKGHWVSPNTKSLVVTVQMVTATSPWPSMAPQTLDVATPQPCSGSPTAGYNCTFAIHAFVGTNVFTFATYAVASPGPNDTPLSTLTSGITNVTNGKSLDFVLQGVVSKVLLSVPQPESSLAPTTQAVPIGVATSFPLFIDTRDSSNASIAGDTFASPVTITAGPSNSGVSLALTPPSPCPGDVNTPTKVVLNCAADLTHVSVVYDGSVTRSTGFSYVDTATIAASPQPATSPSPAVVALASNVVEYPLVPAPNPSGYVSTFSNLSLDAANGHLIAAYFNSPTGYLVDFNPSTMTATTGTFNFAADHVTLDPNGDIWTTDTSSAAIHCFSSISAAPVTVAIADANGPLGTETTVSTDTSGNVWFGGVDTSSYPAVGSLPNTCTGGSANANTIFGSLYDGYVNLAPAAPIGGVPAMWTTAGYTNYNLYAFTASTSSSPPPLASFPGGESVQGVTSDTSHNLFAVTSLASGGAVDEVPAGSSSISTVSTLVPQSYPYNIAQYSGTFASAQALAMIDSSHEAGVLINPVSTATEPLELPLGGYYCYPTSFDENGNAWVLCSHADGSLWAHRMVVTSTWDPLIGSYALCSPFTTVLGVPEASVSQAPFTVTTSDASVIAVATPFPGNYPHELPITINGAGPVTLTITDKNGRTAQVSTTVLNSGCSHPRPNRRNPNPRR